MKFSTILICFSLVLLNSIVFAQSEHKECGFNKIYQGLQNDSNFLAVQAKMKQDIKQTHFLKSDTVIVIPVVVHVIYKNETENISDAQIFSQIEALNKDMRMLNADTTIVKSYFSRTDTKIEFCLARVAPDSSWTNGITRTFTTFDDVGLSNRYYQIKPSWGNDDYLNIWVCDFGGNVAGQAYPPGSPADRDGLVIDYTNFGTIGTVISPYNLGRTVTHEIGHWLNLVHIWGTNDVNPNCSNDDGVADTPNQSTIYTKCERSVSSCSSEDMTTNYMGYVFDRCMANFTDGQKTRMRTSLLTSRAAILQSDKGCNAVGIKKEQIKETYSLYPNPSNGKFFLQLISKPSNYHFELVDLTGKAVPFQVISLGDQFQFELNNTNSGIYFLKIKTEKTQQVKKLILNIR